MKAKTFLRALSIKAKSRKRSGKKLTKSYVSLFFVMILALSSTMAWFTEREAAELKSNDLEFQSASSLRINKDKFIANKIGININMNDNDLNGFVYQYLSNYSNEDIFNLVVAAIDLKKNQVDLDNVYKSGICGEDLYNALNIVKGSLTQDVMRNYYL